MLPSIGGKILGKSDPILIDFILIGFFLIHLSSLISFSLMVYQIPFRHFCCSPFPIFFPFGMTCLSIIQLILMLVVGRSCSEPFTDLLLSYANQVDWLYSVRLKTDQLVFVMDATSSESDQTWQSSASVLLALTGIDANFTSSLLGTSEL